MYHERFARCVAVNGQTAEVTTPDGDDYEESIVQDVDIGFVAVLAGQGGAVVGVPRGTSTARLDLSFFTPAHRAKKR